MNSYDEWLALTDAQREQMQQAWNVYAREGYCIALMAAARLTFAIPHRVMDVQIGTCHGGAWALHIFPENPPSDALRQQIPSFEGFPVIWLSAKS